MWENLCKVLNTFKLTTICNFLAFVQDYTFYKDVTANDKSSFDT